MTSVPRWEPDGTESPAERTDPLLPAITDDMLPPLDLPRLPTLDDRTLERMLAELEGDEPGAAVDPASSTDPSAGGGRDPVVPRDRATALDPTRAETDPPDTAEATNPAAASADDAVDFPARDFPAGDFPARDTTANRTTGPGGPGGEPSERPLRLVGHPGGPVGYRPARGPVSARSGDRYIRRDVRPPEVHADALSLTGLTRRSRSRVGSILFRVVFVGIFLLILVQAIVSLLTPGG